MTLTLNISYPPGCVVADIVNLWALVHLLLTPASVTAYLLLFFLSFPPLLYIFLNIACVCIINRTSFISFPYWDFCSGIIRKIPTSVCSTLLFSFFFWKDKNLIDRSCPFLCVRWYNTYKFFSFFFFFWNQTIRIARRLVSYFSLSLESFVFCRREDCVSLFIISQSASLLRSIFY